MRLARNGDSDMQMSGKVAILNEAQDKVLEIRNLGPEPIDVKDNGTARPFTEVIPTYNEATERLIGYADVISDTVTRTWTKAAIDFVLEDGNKMNAELVEPGSILRAVIAVMRDEINTLRTHAAIALPARTVAQVTAALKAKMRT